MLTVQQLDGLTDKLESFATVAYDWTRTHQAVVKLTVGGIVLLYSPRLSCSLLLFNCVKGVGLPLLQKSFGELYQSYRKFKTTVKEEAPALEDAVKNLNAVKKEVDDLTVIIKELQAMTTPDEAKIKASMEKAKTDIAKLGAASSQAMEVGRRINSKVDYSSLKRVVHDMYMIVLTGIASAQNSTIANCSIGISLGASITEHLQHFIKNYEASITAAAKKVDDKLEADSKSMSSQIAGALLEPDKIVGQLNSLAFIIGNTAGLTASLYATSYSRLAANCTLGSELVLAALEELADPILMKQSLPSVKSNKAYLSSLLVGLGVAYNIWVWVPGSGGYGVIANVLLTPLLFLETAACVIVAHKA